jgi:hypothetical protein
MKTDYRIVGSPYRGTRRKCHMVTGFATRQEAEIAMKEGIEGGWLDPNAHVRSQRVRDDFVGQDFTHDIRAEVHGHITVEGAFGWVNTPSPPATEG